MDLKINNKVVTDRRLLVEIDTIKTGSTNVNCFFVDYLSKEQIELFKKASKKSIEESFIKLDTKNLKKGSILKIMNFDFEIKTIFEDWIRLLPTEIEDIGIESYDFNNSDNIDFEF